MTDFLLLAFVFLIAGVIAVPIASRLGLGSVLGYLIAGILISPILTWLRVDVISIQHFAEFGVVMMLFLVGLELEPKLLWSMRAKLLGLGGGQVAITTLLVMAVGMAFSLVWTVALAVGLVFTLSSTAIVLQTLNEKGLMKSDGGQSSFSVLLFQDIAIIPMLALVPLLALPELIEAVSHTADDGHGDNLSLVAGLMGWQIALVTLGAIAVVIVAGSYLTGPIFRFIAATNLREMFVATALMIVIGIALLMSLVGLSPALGTFLAGVVLANSEYRHELESDIDPFKGLLLGLFFITVGAGINFGLLGDNFILIIGLTIGLIALKSGVLYVLAIVFKVQGADRWLFALGLAQAGEFGFVLLSFTVANGVIPTALAEQLLLIVALSMLLTPVLFILFDRLIVPYFVVGDTRKSDEMPDGGSKIIIAGHGRVGGLVSRVLNGAGYAPTVIDFSSAQLEFLKQFGAHAYYGDATRPDLLHAAGVADAKLFVIAIDGKQQITELARYLHHQYPNLKIVARAVDRSHVYDLWNAGCRDIIREYYDSALRMGRSSLEALGADRDQADGAVAIFDALDRKGMIEVASHYVSSVPISENEPLIAKVNELRVELDIDLKTQMIAILTEK